jgi:SAM-dependent methyltransferase
MRNLLEETPTTDVHPLAAYALEFVRDEDIRGKRVLDIGCGFGWFEAVALTRGVSSVAGLEPDDSALELPRASIDDDRASFVAGSGIDLPFESRSVDTVVSWEVIEHLPEHSEGRFFDEIARVLRPGGAFYMSTPYAAVASKLTDPAWWLIDHRHYGAGELARMAGASGLEPSELKIRGRWWQVSYALNLYFSKWVLRRGLVFERTFRDRVRREFEAPGWCNVFMRCRSAAA